MPSPVPSPDPSGSMKRQATSPVPGTERVSKKRANSHSLKSSGINEDTKGEMKMEDIKDEHIQEEESDDEHSFTRSQAPDNHSEDLDPPNYLDVPLTLSSEFLPESPNEYSMVTMQIEYDMLKSPTRPSRKTESLGTYDTNKNNSPTLKLRNSNNSNPQNTKNYTHGQGNKFTDQTNITPTVGRVPDKNNALKCQDEVKNNSIILISDEDTKSLGENDLMMAVNVQQSEHLRQNFDFHHLERNGLQPAYVSQTFDDGSDIYSLLITWLTETIVNHPVFPELHTIDHFLSFLINRLLERPFGDVVNISAAPRRMPPTAEHCSDQYYNRINMDISQQAAGPETFYHYSYDRNISSGSHQPVSPEDFTSQYNIRANDGLYQQVDPQYYSQGCSRFNVMGPQQPVGADHIADHSNDRPVDRFLEEMKRYVSLQKRSNVPQQQVGVDHILQHPNYRFNVPTAQQTVRPEHVGHQYYNRFNVPQQQVGVDHILQHPNYRMNMEGTQQAAEIEFYSLLQNRINMEDHRQSIPTRYVSSQFYCRGFVEGVSLERFQMPNVDVPASPRTREFVVPTQADSSFPHCQCSLNGGIRCAHHSFDESLFGAANYEHFSSNNATRARGTTIATQTNTSLTRIHCSFDAGYGYPHHIKENMSSEDEEYSNDSSTRGEEIISQSTQTDSFFNNCQCSCSRCTRPPHYNVEYPDSTADCEQVSNSNANRRIEIISHSTQTDSSFLNVQHSLDRDTRSARHREERLNSPADDEYISNNNVTRYSDRHVAGPSNLHCDISTENPVYWDIQDTVVAERIIQLNLRLPEQDAVVRACRMKKLKRAQNSMQPPTFPIHTFPGVVSTLPDDIQPVLPDMRCMSHFLTYFHLITDIEPNLPTNFSYFAP